MGRGLASLATAERIDWSTVAAACAKRIPRDSLHRAVLAWADGRTRAARGPWGVAFSGGADSLALLLSVWMHWPAKRARLVALHFNHRLRGTAAEGDAQFCRLVCGVLGIRLKVGAWSRSKDESISEASARTARFGYFDRELRRFRAGALWLGQQKNDIAETLLMRLARGSGVSGLAAPRPVQVLPDGRVNVRPLLTLSKSELCEALRASGAVWREDSTNAESTYFRNRIRNEVIPAWCEATGGRDALSGAALSRDLLDEDAVALEAWIDELHALRGRVLDLRVLAGKPRAVFRRALQRWLVALGEDAGDLSRQGFEALLMALEAGLAKRFSVGRNGFALIADSTLKFEKTRRE